MSRFNGGANESSSPEYSLTASDSDWSEDSACLKELTALSQAALEVDKTCMTTAEKEFTDKLHQPRPSTVAPAPIPRTAQTLTKHSSSIIVSSKALAQMEEQKHDDERPERRSPPKEHRSLLSTKEVGPGHDFNVSLAVKCFTRFHRIHCLFFALSAFL